MGDNNELANVQNAALTSSILSKNGIDTDLPFSRDIFLMNTMINGTGFITLPTVRQLK